jgi:hypothetical protein
MWGSQVSAYLFKGFFLGITFLSLLQPAAAQNAPPQVSDFFDNRFTGVQEDWTSPELSKSRLKPVAPLVGAVAEEPKYTTELVRLQWRKADPIDLYVMKPTGIKKPPVIVYMYGYPSDLDRFQRPELQELLTRDGVAAVGFLSALTGGRYHNRPMKQWFLSELQESLAVSAHDVQMALNYLEQRGDLDTTRIGMCAQLSGASIAILASAADPRIGVVDVLDPWGDWPTWMEKSPFVPDEERADYVKPEFLKKAGLLDPVQWLPKIKAQKFRLQQRTFEWETPAPAKEKLHSAVPPSGTVVSYETTNDFLNAVGSGGEKALDWIKHEVKALPRPLASSRE